MEEVKKEKELKKGKKKNKVASLLLALALILTCGVAGTIAQYQKSFTGGSTATVAKFNVTDNNTTASFDLFKNVYDTDDGGVEENDVASDLIAPGTQGYADIQVKNDSEVNVTLDLEAKLNGTGQIIGTKAGTDTITNADKHQNQYIPLQFAVKATLNGDDLTVPTSQSDFPGTSEWSTVTTTPTADPAGNLSDTIKAAIVKANAATTRDNGVAQGSTMYVRIYWRWAYNDTTDEATRNELDTVIGEAMAKGTAGQSVFKSPVLSVKATIKQVN